MRFICTVFAAVVSLFCWLSEARADKYYCLIFSWDAKILRMPTKCHTWGTFVRVDDKGKLVREVTLSWTPEAWQVMDRGCPGYHQPLHDSIRFAMKKRWVIRMWGPFEIDSHFYEKAVVQYERTDMQYKFIDCVSRRRTKGRAVNCIHCVSDVAGDHKTWVLWGAWASSSVRRFFDRQGLISELQPFEKQRVIDILDLDKYPIIWKR